MLYDYINILQACTHVMNGVELCLLIIQTPIICYFINRLVDWVREEWSGGISTSRPGAQIHKSILCKERTLEVL